jgi:putative toprim domain protein
MADRLELSDPWWFTNPYAMVKSDELMAMRSRTVRALNATEGDTTGAYQQIKENLGDMDAEITRRRWEVSGDQRELEQIIRGERPRSGHNFTLHKVLSEEQRVRQHLIPSIDLPETKRPEQIQNGVSGHTLDRFWENHPHLHNTRLGTILRSRSREIGQLAQVRGAQLAAEKPEWVKQLGEVPANKKLARHWYRVAAETEALRDKYNVASSEPEAVPTKLRTQEKPHEAPTKAEARGKFLHAQVVSTHKRSVMAAHQRAPKTEAENAQIAQTRDTRQRAQEARREGNPPLAATHPMLIHEQIKRYQNSLTHTETRNPQQKHTVEQTITAHRAQRQSSETSDEQLQKVQRLHAMSFGNLNRRRQQPPQQKQDARDYAQRQRQNQKQSTTGKEL